MGNGTKVPRKATRGGSRRRGRDGSGGALLEGAAQDGGEGDGAALVEVHRHLDVRRGGTQLLVGGAAQAVLEGGGGAADGRDPDLDRRHIAVDERREELGAH